jgi:hypothetical protein
VVEDFVEEDERHVQLLFVEDFEARLHVLFEFVAVNL